jgi:hypothetical protein
MMLPHPVLPKTMESVKANAARFARREFGSAGEMRVIQKLRSWLIEIRVEGVSIQDAGYVAAKQVRFDTFWRGGFGALARIDFTARLEAGDPQTGAPNDQLIMVPPLVIEELQK